MSRLLCFVHKLGKTFLITFGITLFVSCASDAEVYDLKQEEVDSIVKSHLEDIHECYREGLSNDLNLRGKFVLMWTINGKGKVENEAVKNADEEVKTTAECCLKHLKEWQFPKLGGERTAHIEYPFTLGAIPRN
jgi:hypothetical protein